MTNPSKTYPPYLWPVGPGGLVAAERIVAVGRYDSAPIRRAVRLARTQGKLIDLTYGKACLWVIYLDSGHLALASEPMPVTAVPDEFTNYLEET
jgi:hypothetical protein